MSYFPVIKNDMHTRKLLISVITFFLIQCTTFINENTPEVVSAVIEGDDLVIRNDNRFDVYFFAVDEETSFVIDWMPQNSEENKIQSKRTRVFSKDQIVGYQSNKTVIVFIWGNNQNYWKTIEIKP